MPAIGIAHEKPESSSSRPSITHRFYNHPVPWPPSVPALTPEWLITTQVRQDGTCRYLDLLRASPTRPPSGTNDPLQHILRGIQPQDTSPATYPPPSAPPSPGREPAAGCSPVFPTTSIPTDDVDRRHHYVPPQGSNHSALLAPVLLVMPSSVAASATFVIPRQLCSATILTGVRQSPSER